MRLPISVALTLAACDSSDDLAALQEQLDDVSAELAALRSEHDALAAGLDDYALSADLDDYVLRAESPAWILGIDTIEVPSEQPTIAAALALLANTRIGPSGYVIISVEPGTYEFSAPINVYHPDGSRIRLQGAGTVASDVILHFATTNGITGNPGSLLQLTVRGGDVTDTTGVLVSNGLTGLTSVVVEDFHSGIRASQGGVISAFDTTSRSNTAEGWHADGGYIYTEQCDALDNNLGLRASFGGRITTIGMVASGNTTNASPAMAGLGTGWNMGVLEPP